VTIRICGAGTAFLGFGMSLIIGLCAQNSYTTIIMRALTVMLLFYFLGIALAYMGQKVIEENFKAEVAAMEAEEQLKEESSSQQDNEGDVEDDIEDELAAAVAT
jgi:hypothetical protein